jgi:hypothetical protein
MFYKNFKSAVNGGVFSSICSFPYLSSFTHNQYSPSYVKDGDTITVEHTNRSGDMEFLNVGKDIIVISPNESFKFCYTITNGEFDITGYEKGYFHSCK